MHMFEFQEAWINPLQITSICYEEKGGLLVIYKTAGDPLIFLEITISEFHELMFDKIANA